MVEIYTDGDPKKVERNMHATIPYFWDPMIVTDMKSGKIILKNASVISPLTSEQKCYA